MQMASLQEKVEGEEKGREESPLPEELWVSTTMSEKKQPV